MTDLRATILAATDEIVADITDLRAIILTDRLLTDEEVLRAMLLLDSAHRTSRYAKEAMFKRWMEACRETASQAAGVET